jgi:hypothetical protein
MIDSTITDGVISGAGSLAVPVALRLLLRAVLLAGVAAIYSFRERR